MLTLSGIYGTIEGRIKSIPSIYRKIARYESEGKASPMVENIRDVIAFRIIPKDEEGCYSILSALTSLYETVEGSLDDYIAKPKQNGYRSIHVTLLDESKNSFEVQIKTEDMHRFNEYGPAAHVAYKQFGSSNSKANPHFQFIEDIAETKMIYDPNEDKPIPLSLFSDKIYAMTPKNEFIELPQNATPIDFAYAVHTRLGDQYIGVKINGRNAAHDTFLKTGDIVEIIVNPKKEYPDEQWLRICTTSKAREKILSALNKKKSRSMTDSDRT